MLTEYFLRPGVFYEQLYKKQGIDDTFDLETIFDQSYMLEWKLENLNRRLNNILMN